jgi:hypothetical protein
MNLNSKVLFLLSLFIFTSCGVRNDDTAYSNPFVGNWKLAGIDCYDTNLTGSKLEIYRNNTADTNEILFTGRTFIYSVSGNGGVCNTSANGTYLIDYANAEEGKISYSSITTSPGCSISHDSSSGATSSNIPFGFITSEINTTNITWKISNEELTLQLSTGYKGGASAPPFCASNCTCYGRYSKEITN